MRRTETDVSAVAPCELLLCSRRGPLGFVSCEACVDLLFVSVGRLPRAAHSAWLWGVIAPAGLAQGARAFASRYLRVPRVASSHKGCSQSMIERL